MCIYLDFSVNEVLMKSINDFTEVVCVQKVVYLINLGKHYLKINLKVWSLYQRNGMNNEMNHSV